MKKLRLLALIGAAALCAGTMATLTSCGGNGVKFGFIFLHDTNSSYDNNFIEAAKIACENKGVTPVLQVNIDEKEVCKTTAEDLVNRGCKGVFADSFGHEPFLLEVAKNHPEVQFAHATGTTAHTEKLDNFHNAFANIYEGRYIAGVAAGMKLNEMINNHTISADQAVMGYVGAYPYAEVVSGYTSFYLGAKSVCPSVTMKVRYTNSWYDPTGENSTATTLIEQDGCKLISQHADSQGAPSVCNDKGIPNVFYNGENTQQTNSYLTSCRINWVPFFEYFIENTLNGTKMDYDWCGSLANGAVEYYNPSSIAAAGTKEKMDEVAGKIKDGTLKVFDTNSFTVNGQKLISYMADVDTDANYTPDKQVIEDGVFKESVYRSAPYFDIRIDGITEL